MNNNPLQRNQHRRQSVAPILITVLTIAYFVLYFGLLIWVLPNRVFQVLCGMIGVALVITMIVTCRARLKEIKGGETDDLSQY